MEKVDVVIVGAGFLGLTAAYELSRQGRTVRVVEMDKTPGGLAGTFSFDDGTTVEKFYHHWFNSDIDIKSLVAELGLNECVITHPSSTGMYFNKRIWRLSSPLDLLRFNALSLIDRIRLGILVLRVRRIKHWKPIEHLTIREWLVPLCGESAFKVVWEPLINAKFSMYAELVNAVWMWKKLVLRGSTRKKNGVEELSYFKGGFGRLAEEIVKEIRRNKGDVIFNCRVTGIRVSDKKIMTLLTEQGAIEGSQYLFTPAFPIIAKILRSSDNLNWINQLMRVKYLGNVCLILRLKCSLSDTYWLNVNDPGFPFVGVIEHTNLDVKENYKGTHIAYLSRYLTVDDPVWNYSDDEYFNFAFMHLKRMFPTLIRSWIVDYKVWRAEYAQPVTEPNYSEYVPGRDTPFLNAFVSTMAHIYPEDRGTNYAVREGRAIASYISEKLSI